MSGVSAYDKLFYLCPACQDDRFPPPQNEGHIPLGSLREEAHEAELAPYASPNERLVHVLLEPFRWRPNISLSLDGVADINLDDVDEIQAGENGWIVSYGAGGIYGRCRHCGMDRMAVRFGSVRFSWIQAVVTDPPLPSYVALRLVRSEERSS